MLSKTILLLLVLCIGSPLEGQGKQYFLPTDDLIRLVGVLKGKGRNTLEVQEEKSKELRRLIYVGNSDQFQIGDKLLVYCTNRGQVKEIRKMTVLEYRAEGQNLGYINRHD